MSENDSTVEPSDRADSDRHQTYGPAAVALLTIALTAWPIAFNLGAYDAVFYQDVFQVVVVSTVGFVLAVIKPPYRGATLLFTRVALAGPMGWMALAVVLFDTLGAATSDPVYGIVGLLVAVVSVPIVLKLLIDMFARDLTTVPGPTHAGRRHRRRRADRHRRIHRREEQRRLSHLRRFQDRRIGSAGQLRTGVRAMRPGSAGERTQHTGRRCRRTRPDQIVPHLTKLGVHGTSCCRRADDDRRANQAPESPSLGEWLRGDGHL